MPIGIHSVGGSKGRPTPWPEGGIILKGCIQNPFKNILNLPCLQAVPHFNNSKLLILNNDWYYKKGNVNSTTGGASTGGISSAKKRRC